MKVASELKDVVAGSGVRDSELRTVTLEMHKALLANPDVRPWETSPDKIASVAHEHAVAFLEFQNRVASGTAGEL